jgi:hypothetical protein
VFVLLPGRVPTVSGHRIEPPSLGDLASFQLVQAATLLKSDRQLHSLPPPAAPATIRLRPGQREAAMAPHALEQHWCFCGSTIDRTQSYEDNQRSLGDFSTAEDFWGLWRGLAKPTQLFRTSAQLEAARGGGCGEQQLSQSRAEALCLFKRGISPQWEDPANIAGGQFFWRPAVDVRSSRALDATWEELVLAMIGGREFGGCAHVCGLRVVDKSKRAWSQRGAKGRPARQQPATCNYRFELWFGHGAVIEDDTRDMIADDLQRLLQPIQPEREPDIGIKMHGQAISHAEVKEAAWAERKKQSRNKNAQRSSAKPAAAPSAPAQSAVPAPAPAPAPQPAPAPKAKAVGVAVGSVGIDVGSGGASKVLIEPSSAADIDAAGPAPAGGLAAELAAKICRAALAKH